MLDTRTLSVCAHCGLPSGGEPFCCTGCENVHALLQAGELSRYYAIRGGTGVPVDASRRAPDYKWAEQLARGQEQEARACYDLDVQGLHCSACVWLIEQLFEKQRGSQVLDVNPALGTVHITAGEGFSLVDFATRLSAFGYTLGPKKKEQPKEHDALLLRLGICLAIAMNAMSFAFATYAGLSAGLVYDVMTRTGWVLSLLSVLIGGSVFFKSAWRGLRHGVVHLDTTIALGTLLAFAASTWSYFAGGKAHYFDTISVFVALMLVGRFVQERILRRNRAELLAADDASNLLTRRINANGVSEIVRAGDLAVGDTLVLCRGDLLPVAAVLRDSRAEMSLDWISGEAEPQAFAQGTTVPAGAFLASRNAAHLECAEEASSSRLQDLLRQPRVRDPWGARTTSFWQAFSRYYVFGVLAVAAFGFALSYVWGRGVIGALDVSTAILVVTCPCAFGIATPVAYELVQAGLRRAGLYVRSAGFLDRAAMVRHVVLDKTGTLTTGALSLSHASKQLIGQLSDNDRTVLGALASASSHPKALAVHAILAQREVMGLELDEITGMGIEGRMHGKVFRLGRPNWVCALSEEMVDRAPSDLAFGTATQFVPLQTEETLRKDAPSEVKALKQAGYRISVLSGDQDDKVKQVAETIAADAWYGEHDPEAKAAWIEQHDRGDVLFIGDGVNDAIAINRATTSGTPAVDRPFVVARADFFFVTPGVAPIRIALRAAQVLRRVTLRNAVFAVSYNAGAVALCLAGWMTPLHAAVLMPVSSLFVLLTTRHSLSKGARLWRS